MDYAEKKYDHLELPIDFVKYKSFKTQFENASREVFEQICKAIVYYDRNGEIFEY